MPAEHDYVKYPELSNKQLEHEQFNSPHPQIREDFEATVERVHDGDTVTLSTSFRDFLFPLRLLGIDAPEMSEGGEDARDWLRGRILGSRILVLIDPHNRVGKYGRLLGKIMWSGLDVGEEMMNLGLVAAFGEKDEGVPEPANKIFRLEAYL